VDPKVRVSTGLLSDVYYTLNQADIRLHCPRNEERKPIPVLLVEMNTETPWFSHFEVNLDEKGWGRKYARFRCPLHEEADVIQARPVNKLGREGIASQIAVLCDAE
jgi:hypothetical protein